MYRARVTKAGAKRFDLPEGTIVEYQEIHPLGLVVLDVVVGGRQTASSMGFTGDDRTVDLISWPPDFDYKGE